nr:SgcJ/EcaC family oxidoreductase [uncultured Allomuricauda sp.]
MKQLIFMTFIGLLGLKSHAQNLPNQKYSNDVQAIKETINNWDTAWEKKDLELAIQDYADTTDWTNAFGDRVQSKNELKKLLELIFSMDFVMSGKNNYGVPYITFLTDQIATVRSKNIRTNQKWADGSKMQDRDINHLRVYKKINGQWLIINHMISQAHSKGPK